MPKWQLNASGNPYARCNSAYGSTAQVKAANVSVRVAKFGQPRMKATVTRLLEESLWSLWARRREG